MHNLKIFQLVISLCLGYTVGIGKFIFEFLFLLVRVFIIFVESCNYIIISSLLLNLQAGGWMRTYFILGFTLWNICS